MMEVFSPDPSICKKNSERIPDAYGFGHYKLYRDVKSDYLKKKKFPVSSKDCIETVKLLNSFYISDEKKKNISVKSCKDSTRLGRSDEKISKLFR